MKELNISDLELVSGGREPWYIDPVDAITVLGATTSGGRSISAAATADTIARSAARGGLLGLAFAAGWNTGTYLYHETPLGERLGSEIDKFTGLNRELHNPRFFKRQ